MKYFRQRRGIIKSFIIVLTVAVFSCDLLWSYNQAFKLTEDEAPLDHLRSLFLKPFYAMTCPKYVPIKCDKTTPTFLVHGRPSDEQFQLVWKSWRESIQDISIIDTYNMSLSYRNTKCHYFQWHQRLFHVYQLVFDHVLSKHSQPKNQGFVFIEDDVLLLNSTLFYDQLCIAQQYEFYSFYETESYNERVSSSCLYHHGTPSFYITRSLMEKLIHDVSVDSFCRLPVDMYIATLGPWYKVSMKETIVQHIGSRFHVQERNISPISVTP